MYIHQANAAVGVPSAPLAGGCACCALGQPLEAALADIRSSAAGRDLDCLVGGGPGQGAVVD
jgi:hypothetical protein